MSVIVAVMVWMQASSNAVSNTTSGEVNAVLCAVKDCSSSANCTTSPCPSNGICGPAGKCQAP